MTGTDAPVDVVAAFEAEDHRHTLRPMAGRDPDESHRAASPLELLYDLTFVVAFSQASSQFAHLIAEGPVKAGVTAVAFAMIGE